MKVIRDAVHGDIVLEKIFFEVIGHRYFQRLRRISQNGPLYLVFPSMRHSRFEHSIGVAHLAGLAFSNILSAADTRANGLYAREKRASVIVGHELALNTRHTRAVIRAQFCEPRKGPFWRKIFMLAGLCHDLGHGPFSHAFEEFGLCRRERILATAPLTSPLFRKHLAGLSGDLIGHEDLALVYLDQIFDDLAPAFAADPDFMGYEIERIKIFVASIFNKNILALLCAEGSAVSNMERRALLLLAGYMTGVFDIDKIDYIRRDSLMGGLFIGNIDQTRILRGLTPVIVSKAGHEKSGIVVDSKFVHLLDHFVITLFEMYTQVYFHHAHLRIQHELSLIIDKERTRLIDSLDFDTLSALGDDDFISGILSKRQSEFMRGIFSRDPAFRDGKKVSYSPLTASRKLEGYMRDSGWTLLDIPPRRVIKDEQSIFVTERLPLANGRLAQRYIRWEKISLVAKNLRNVMFAPKVYWKNTRFQKRLAEAWQQESP